MSGRGHRVDGDRRRPGRVAGAVTAAALLLGGISGCNFVGTKVAPETAATVEGTAIPSETVEELVRIFRTTEAGKEKDPQTGAILVSDQVVRQTALSYQIKIVFLEALAKREGIDIEEATGEEDLFEDLIKAPSLAGHGVRSIDLEIAARAEKLQKAIAAKLLPDSAVGVNDRELEDAYKLREEALGESFRAQTDIAFMNTEEDAEKLREAVKDGEDFKEAAADLDPLRVDSVEISPLSPIQGDFIARVKALDEGETSEPLAFTVDDGPLYVVLHVSEREDLKALTLDDKQVREELSDVVRDSKRFQFFEQWFDKRFREAKVDVDDYYGKWTPRSLAVT